MTDSPRDDPRGCLLIFIPFVFLPNKIELIASISSIGSIEFGNRTHRKVPVRLCSITEPIEQQSNDWIRLIFGSVLFDLTTRTKFPKRSSPLTAAETWTTFLARFKPITVAVPFSELARASKFSTRDSSNHSLRFIVDLSDSHTRDKHEITSKEIHGSHVFIDNNHLALSDILQLI